MKMLKHSVVWLLATSVVCLAWDNSSKMDMKYERYMEKRAYYFAEEEDRSVGSDIELTEKERIVNDRLMALKWAELDNGLKDPKDFIPWNHIFSVLDRINSSEIFHIIQRMPKGGILHAHDTALCSTNYVISLTYEPNLWQCADPTTGALQFLFARSAPLSTGTCQWILVADARAAQGEEKYNSVLRAQLSLYNTHPRTLNLDVNSIWNAFMNIFGVNSGILCYSVIYKAYYKNFLKEMLEDNVQYLELRTTLPTLYDLDGKKYNESEVMQIYFDATVEFKKENPTFIDARIIYAPVRAVDDAGIVEIMAKVRLLHKQFPHFMIGFDLVGQEDKGRPLIDFSKEILKLPDTLNFYFHAGETSWDGMTDNNLIDAVLLDTRRIGHGYAILKHPRVLKEIKRKNIAIEVCPISNQVLRLVEDYRNHPGCIFLANDYPMVISSDDPSFWEATPLSHDFYMAFTGLSARHQGLGMLKQLAINSIKYSAMTPTEQEKAFIKWNIEWKKFIDEFSA